MTEAIHLHDELVQALQLLIPQTTYHDLRRLNTLAWAVTGLCLKQTVRLSAWAEVTQSRATLAASRVRRFSRWLHTQAISPFHWYQPMMQAALATFPPASRLYLALDTTALPPFVVIQVSLIYGGRAIPLVWRAMQHQSTTVAFEDYQPVLEQARAILPDKPGDHAVGRSRLCPPATAALSAQPALALSPATDGQDAHSSASQTDGRGQRTCSQTRRALLLPARCPPGSCRWTCPAFRLPPPLTIPMIPGSSLVMNQPRL